MHLFLMLLLPFINCYRDMYFMENIDYAEAHYSMRITLSAVFLEYLPFLNIQMEHTFLWNATVIVIGTCRSLQPVFKPGLTQVFIVI